MHSFLNGIVSDLKKLIHLHYFVNIILSSSFYFLRVVYPFCYVLFSDSKCELDWREWEITMFVAVVIVFKTRKSGATTMLAYLSAAFMYCKIGNFILFMSNDPRMGIAYAVLCIVQFLLLPEPTYSGPENIVYFRGPNLQDELNNDRRIIWLIAFYAAWSPACVNFAPIFAEVSAEYALENLKFGKLDVTRYPDVAKQFYVNDSSFSKQLPTIALFRNGREVSRRPLVDDKGKLQKFFFAVDNIKAAFDLNNLYQECKSNPIKSKTATKSQLNDKVTPIQGGSNGHPKSE